MCTCTRVTARKFLHPRKRCNPLDESRCNFFQCSVHCVHWEMHTSINHIHIWLWLNYTLVCVPPQTNTYQGILITNGTQSYAVFTYNCELLNPRSVAGIGYYFSNTQFEEHPLSNTNRSSTIACANSPSSPWNSVVFSKLHERSYSYMYILCTNRFCF